MAISQVTTGLWGGKRNGSFAGKTASAGTRPSHAAHQVVTGMWGGRRHASFIGKTPGGATLDVSYVIFARRLSRR